MRENPLGGRAGQSRLLGEDFPASTGKNRQSSFRPVRPPESASYPASVPEAVLPVHPEPSTSSIGLPDPSPPSVPDLQLSRSSGRDHGPSIPEPRERDCCTISTRTFLVSVGVLTSHKNAMRRPACLLGSSNACESRGYTAHKSARGLSIRGARPLLL
jgi:hypothetical protein